MPIMIQEDQRYFHLRIPGQTPANPIVVVPGAVPGSENNPIYIPDSKGGNSEAAVPRRIPNIGACITSPAHPDLQHPRYLPESLMPPCRPAPIIPPIAELALGSYMHYATGRPPVRNCFLDAFGPPLPIPADDIPDRCESPAPNLYGRNSAMMVMKTAVVESRLYIKRALLEYFNTLEMFPLSSVSACKEYQALAGKKLYAQIMNSLDIVLSSSEEFEYERM
ncbi:hypothetical protein PCANC_23051 [Puccinia coronata f. sp. avenae]|uniref:Uncharacterized protein n=1 Tax=Puccinia coronata f. sp. avenae TaxID=200324 RepID=A0A2N5U5W4_9BASI|nr:hypothetical protein PCANC_23051 [Puccinia coronata f. sp. avenae]